jgi:hypothetical protein
MPFLALNGAGDPNGEAFARQTEALYALSYAVKMSYRSEQVSEGCYDYKAFPLEGVWDLLDYAKPATDKNNLKYTIMIRQPDFLTGALFERFREQTQRKKPNPYLDQVRLIRMEDGLCCQMLHIGPYDDEAANFARMEAYCTEAGYVRTDKTHREIYLPTPAKPNRPSSGRCSGSGCKNAERQASACLFIHVHSSLPFDVAFRMARKMEFPISHIPTQVLHPAPSPNHRFENLESPGARHDVQTRLNGEPAFADFSLFRFILPQIRPQFAHGFRIERQGLARSRVVTNHDDLRFGGGDAVFGQYFVPHRDAFVADPGDPAGDPDVLPGIDRVQVIATDGSDDEPERLVFAGNARPIEKINPGHFQVSNVIRVVDVAHGVRFVVARLQRCLVQHHWSPLFLLCTLDEQELPPDL